MKHIKSERLKRFEAELNDLERWLELGLVPKKDLDKHKEEISAVQKKIEEEKERIQTLRESGELDEGALGKRAQPRPSGYGDMPTVPDIDMAETMIETEGEYKGTEPMTQTFEERGEEEGREDEEDEEEESYFSDRNRWKRGGIIDPEADEW